MMADIAKVKRNIQRMIDQGAPESDIDAYVSSEGTTPEELRGAGAVAQQAVAQAQPSKPSFNSYGMPSEIMDMITMGGSTKLNAVGAGLAGAVGDYVQGKPWDYSGNYSRELEDERADQEAWRNENPVQNVVGKGAGLLVGAGTLPTIGRGVKGLMATSALYGGSTGLMQDAETPRARLINTAKGVGTGLLLGGGIGTAAKVGGAAVNKMRPTISKEVSDAANVLEREGVTLTAGQKTASNRVKIAESELGGNKYQNLIEKQGEQFTSAALNKAGIKANRATPDVLDKAFTDIGKRFDNLATNNSIIPDPQIAQDLVSVATDYTSVVSPSNQARIVQDLVTDAMGYLQSGGISGAQYKAMMSKISRVSRGSVDGELGAALSGIKSTLDDAMERSIAQTNPADLGKWAAARKDYRNMLVIERAATGAGADTALGLIAPHQLRNAAVQKQGRRNQVRGKGDFAELSNAGVALLGKMANSQTAARTSARNLGQGAATLTGTVMGGLLGGPVLGPIVGAGLGYASPKIAGSVIMSKAGQRLLSGKGNARKGGKLIKAVPAAGLLGSEYYRSP